MSTKMTWQEMKKSYPDEWLLIVDFETDESGRLQRGIVERHSPDMDEVAKQPRLHKPTAFRYTGKSTYRGLLSRIQRHNTL